MIIIKSKRTKEGLFCLRSHRLYKDIRRSRGELPRDLIA